MASSDKYIAPILRLIKEENAQLRAQIKADISELSTKVNLLEEKLNSVTVDVAKTADSNTRLDKVERALSTLKRAKNLVIYGIPESVGEKTDRLKTLTTEFHKLCEKLKVHKIVVEDAFRLGKSGMQRPILVKLVRISDKNLILKNKKLLGKEKIFINPDLTKEEQLREQTLRGKLKELQKADPTLSGYVAGGQLHLFRNKKRITENQIIGPEIMDSS